MLLSLKVKDILFKDRFNLIVVNDYLEKSKFQVLRDNYPEDIHFDNKNIFALTLTDKDQKFQEFLNKNETWNNFVNQIKSQEFIKDLISIYKLKFVYSSEKDLRRFFPFFKKVKLELTFNKSKKGSYSDPHTDVTRKILSFVLFFTSDEWNKNDGGIVKLFKPKLHADEDNWRNIITPEHKLDLIDTIFPSSNKIYGFKKSKNSYHSVSSVNCDNNKSRDVFMINLSFSNERDIPHSNLSIFRRAVKKLSKILKLKFV